MHQANDDANNFSSPLSWSQIAVVVCMCVSVYSKWLRYHHYNWKSGRGPTAAKKASFLVLSPSLFLLLPRPYTVACRRNVINTLIYSYTLNSTLHSTGMHIACIWRMCQMTNIWNVFFCWYSLLICIFLYVKQQSPYRTSTCPPPPLRSSLKSASHFCSNWLSLSLCAQNVICKYAWSLNLNSIKRFTRVSLKYFFLFTVCKCNVSFSCLIVKWV